MSRRRPSEEDNAPRRKKPGKPGRRFDPKPEPRPVKPAAPIEPEVEEPVIDLDAEPDASTDENEALEAGPEHRQIHVRNELTKRLDVYLQARLRGISRNRIQKLIDRGGVTINGQVPKASTIIHKDDIIDIILPPRAVRRILPEPIPIHAMYEDEDYVIINKQANLIVHPARGQLSGTLINGLAYRFAQQQHERGRQAQLRTTSGFNAYDRNRPSTTARTGLPGVSGQVDGLSNVGADEFRPGIVHRLDRNTTGVMVVAKNDETHWAIARQFENRTTLKAYLAVVHGNFEEAGGAIELPIGRHPTIREANAVRHDSTARHALTLFRVREQYQGFALVELELKTGRTHQIRVHLQYMGHPIVGDVVYGGEPVGYPELDAPPVAAGSRKHLNYARDKPDGQKIEAIAAGRQDMLIATPALHASLLSFIHPRTHERVQYTAPLHEPMATLVRELRKRPNPTAPIARQGTWVDLDALVPQG